MVVLLTVAVCTVSLQLQLHFTTRQLDQARAQILETRSNLTALSQEITTQTRSLDTVRADVRATREEIGRTQTDVQETRTSLSGTLDAERRERERRMAASREELQTVAADVRGRLRSLQGMAGNAAFMGVANAKAIGDLRQKVVVDPKELRRALLGPSVKVENARAVGGGTCLWSRREASGVVHTYVLTAHHVVSGAISEEDGREKRSPVTVTRYPTDGAAPIACQADVIAYDTKKDLALLKLRGRDASMTAATLASREELARIAVFDKVTAVGCPLGHAPLPTEGEIVSLDKKVSGERFWMMSAPTIFGNSGGGVFDSGSPRLVGVAAMICVYDTIVSMPVTHLGVLVPMTSVYDWLDSQGYQFLYDPRVSREDCERGRAVMRALLPSTVPVSWEEK
ncbi:MAG: trypsin-like peptidase domain-containing protein [Planctomycetes bacterium]|nr:trypsin-like peptidase domain-containing protein [Planctomycetota bacterium]